MPNWEWRSQPCKISLARIAREDLPVSRVANETRRQLETFARRTHEEHLEQAERRRHAKGEMTQLAADMVTFARMRPGVFIP
jgi:hypothetical protein